MIYTLLLQDSLYFSHIFTVNYVDKWSSRNDKFCDMKSPLTPRTLELFYQNKGGNGVLDLLAPEVFYQIMVNLELEDIRICMCVCKKWRVSGRVSTNLRRILRGKVWCK